MRPLKKYPNAADNIVIPKKETKDNNDIELNSSEFPMKTLGLSLASISPGAMAGKRRDSESRENVIPLRT